MLTVILQKETVQKCAWTLISNNLIRKYPRTVMETGTVKLPKALINMSWLMMPMFIDVRGLFVSCQDLGDTKGSGSRISADLFGGTWPNRTPAKLPFARREVLGWPKNSKFFRNVPTCISNIYPQYEKLEPISRPETSNFLGFRQGRRGEWGLGKSILTQIFQILVHSNYIYQLKNRTWEEGPVMISWMGRCSFVWV